MLKPVWAVLVTAGVGALTWVLTAAGSGRREAWDSEIYLMAALPVIATTAAVVAYLVPHRVWRWGMFPFAAQAVLAFIQHPTGSMLPPGLVVFFVLGLLCTVPAWVAAAAAKRFGR